MVYKNGKIYNKHMTKLKSAVLVATGVAVLGGAGVLSAQHYQTQKQPSEAEMLKEENTNLKRALEQSDGEVTALEQKADQVRIECERGSVAYSYLANYQKRMFDRAPTCPPAVPR